MNLNWTGEDDVLDEFLATSKLFDEMPEEWTTPEPVISQQ
jgi:hypothetical protein